MTRYSHLIMALVVYLNAEARRRGHSLDRLSTDQIFLFSHAGAESVVLWCVILVDIVYSCANNYFGSHDIVENLVCSSHGQWVCSGWSSFRRSYGCNPRVRSVYHTWPLSRN